MAENNENIKNETVEGNEETGKVDTQTTNNQNEGTTEVDIKAEAQKIADKMVAKKMKSMPSKEELKAFKKWQGDQKTAEEKQSEKEREYQKTLLEKENLEQELKVLRSGVNKDDADYVLFKVSKMEGDFEENLEKYLGENPKYLKQEVEEKKTSSTGVQTQKQSTFNENGVRTILKNKHPDLF